MGQHTKGREIAGTEWGVRHEKNHPACNSAIELRVSVKGLFLSFLPPSNAPSMYFLSE